MNQTDRVIANRILEDAETLLKVPPRIGGPGAGHRDPQRLDNNGEVKTTLLVPLELWLAAKDRAAREGTSLRDIMLKGLRLYLATVKP